MTPGTPPAPPTGAEVRPRAAGGVVASWLRLGVGTAVGIVQMPILFRHVPPVELGIWYLLFALATFIGLSDLGLPSAFGRAVSYAWGRARSGQAGTGGAAAPGHPIPELYASALVSTLLLGVAFAAAALPVALLYFGATLPPASSAASLLAPLLLFLAGVVLNMVAAIPSAYLSGRGDVAWDNTVRAASTAAGFALLWIVVPRHPSLLALCAVYLAQGTFALASSHAAVVLRARLALRALRPRRDAMRRMYAEAAPIFVTRLGLWLVSESNLLIAGYFLGSSRVPDFAVLRQLASVGSGLILAVPIAASPHAAAAFAAGDEPRVRSLYLAAQRFAMALNVLWAVGLLLWTPEVLGVLVGGGHFLGYAVLVPLAVGGLLECHASSHGFFVWALGRWPFAPHVVAGGILNAIMASAGCALFSFAGLSWGSTLSQALTLHWSVPLHGIARIGLSVRAFARTALLPALAYLVALGAAGLAAKHLLARVALLPGIAPAARGALALGTLLGISATAIAGGALAWFVVLAREDRAYLLSSLGLRRR